MDPYVSYFVPKDTQPISNQPYLFIIKVFINFLRTSHIGKLHTIQHYR
uniref:Uncharacterized protein n=1 Tax=Anguilla anguilla TaxID=7936 RepID=A0A0E9W2H7_ANGAN